MYSWMDFFTKLEPGLVLALSISNFRLLQNLKNKSFINSFVMFVIGLVFVHLKQIAGLKQNMWSFSYEQIEVFANLSLLAWGIMFIFSCKRLFNIKINNEKLNNNLNALVFVIIFSLVFNVVPMVEIGIKNTISLAIAALSIITCFFIGGYYKEVQLNTSAKYCLSSVLVLMAFLPLFLLGDYTAGAEADSLLYSYVLHIAPFVYMLFFFTFMLAVVENTRYIKEKKRKLEMKKQELLQKKAEERHFKEASEQAHRMKIIEQEKAMEDNLLLKMAARGKAMQKIADKASAESESKSGYIAFLSHEVRTPLNGIMGMVRMLGGTKLDAKQQEFVDNLTYSGDSLLALLNDVLDFSKLSSGNMDLEDIGFDLHKFIDNIVLTMEAKADQQGIELKGKYDDQVPQFVKGDPTRLRQVMLNLIGNSIKFTAHGGVYIALKTIKSGPNTCKLRAEVKDTGIGIPDSAKDKLFEEYTQADSSTSRNYGGTGLGLSICKKIIEAMGGEIGVISKEGEGSTFWWEAEFETTRVLDEVTEQRREVATQKEKACEVLVVEDDQISQQVVGSYLSSNGQLPHFASDGESAISMVDAGNIDFVFLDMGLPDMHGIDVCKHIRSKDAIKDIPVIALTGNVSKEDQEKYISQGVNFCLGKPVSPEDIQEALFEIFKLLPESAGKDKEQGGDGRSSSSNSGKSSKPTAKKEVEKEVEKEVKKPSIKKVEKIENEDIATIEVNKDPKKNNNAKVLKLDKVLIVEDDLISQKIIEGYLKNDAHNTTILGNGKEAVKELSKNDYDMVLMDINMPEMNGIEATKKIRSLKDKSKSNVPIIAITGNVSEEDIEGCRLAGMNDFVAKPVDPDYLRGAMMRVANAGRTSSDFAFESVNKYLENQHIPVPKHKTPVAVEVPVEASELNKSVQGLPYVLVIEDDPLSQRIVSEYLTSFKYNPVVAGSAEEGLSLMDKSTFLAVLMDIDLPGMSGLEATKKIRVMDNKVKANVPIIAITGNIKQKDVEACREVGMNDFIGKPINPNYLKGALERNQGSVENVNLEESELMKHLDTEVLGNLKKSFSPDIFQGLLSQFGVSSSEAQKALIDAVAAEDRDAIKSKAHLLKGMSRNIGLKIVGNFMEALEKGSQNESIEDIKDITLEADGVLEEAKAALNAWFDKWKSGN